MSVWGTRVEISKFVLGEAKTALQLALFDQLKPFPPDAQGPVDISEARGNEPNPHVLRKPAPNLGFYSRDLSIRCSSAPLEHRPRPEPSLTTRREEAFYEVTHSAG